MRLALLIVLGVLVAGCIQQETPKADDSKMDALISDAMTDAKTTVVSITTSSTTTTTYTLATATTVVRPATTLTTGTTVLSPDHGGIECAYISEPMGQKDCDKGYCPSTGLKCRYLPGSFASGQAKCACARPK